MARLKGCVEYQGVSRLVSKPINKPAIDEWYSQGSDEQQAIWREMSIGNRNVVINAVAGSGKTFVLVEWAKRQGNSGNLIALVAFNKHIANELKYRLGDIKNVHPMTYHSLGFKQIRKAVRRVSVDQYKVDGILDGITIPQAENDWQTRNVKYKIKHMVGLAKQYGVRDKLTLQWIADHHDVDLAEWDEIVYQWVPKILDKCKDNLATVDFDDMVWLPKELGLCDREYDVICVDELQDTNTVQQYIALNSGHRVIGVGDRFQSIYGFRGADVNSIDRVIDALRNTQRGVVEMPLTVTRRCPKLHTSMAQRIVECIRPLEGAIEGVIRDCPKDKAMAEMAPGDLVVCRVNADLLGVAYSLLKMGKRAVVRGKDIGKGLVKLIERARKEAEKEGVEGEGLNNVAMMLGYAGKITRDEVVKYMELPHGKGEMRAAQTQDKMDCLVEIAGQCKTVAELLGGIERLFADFEEDGKPVDKIVLGTVHRTKGLEAGRVWVLRGDVIPHPMAKSQWERKQEEHIFYIAVTRSRSELIWVDVRSNLCKDN